MITELTEKYFRCQCQSPEHLMIMSYFNDDEDGEVYCSIHLKPLPFLQRVINGIKYIFGHRSKYGDFDEFIFQSKDWFEINKIAHYLYRLNKKQSEEK